MTRDRTQIKDILRREEDKVATVYQDSLGYWTIGVGRLVDKRKGGGLRDKEIEYMLDNDVEEIETELLARYHWMARLSPVRLDAMILMRFQLGALGMSQFTGTLAALEAGDYGKAASGMLDSKWARQTPARVARLAAQVRTDIYPT